MAGYARQEANVGECVHADYEEKLRRPPAPAVQFFQRVDGVGRPRRVSSMSLARMSRGVRLRPATPSRSGESGRQGIQQPVRRVVGGHEPQFVERQGLAGRLRGVQMAAATGRACRRACPGAAASSWARAAESRRIRSGSSSVLSWRARRAVSAALVICHSARQRGQPLARHRGDPHEGQPKRRDVACASRRSARIVERVGLAGDRQLRLGEHVGRRTAVPRESCRSHRPGSAGRAGHVHQMNRGPWSGSM